VFDTAHGKPVVHTQTQDLSIIGAAIFSEHADLTGSVVTLLLAYPSRSAGEVPKVLKVKARVVSTVRTPGMPHYRHGLSFIRSPDDGSDDLEEILRAVAAVTLRKASDAADAVTGLDASVAGGRLAQLRQRASSKAAEGKMADPQDAINATISEALEIAYRYLKDLAEQLNVIGPAYPKGYSISGVPEFTGRNRHVRPERAGDIREQAEAVGLAVVVGNGGDRLPGGGRDDSRKRETGGVFG